LTIALDSLDYSPIFISALLFLTWRLEILLSPLPFAFLLFLPCRAHDWQQKDALDEMLELLSGQMRRVEQPVTRVRRSRPSKLVV
jgi:hypothetical protein